MFASSIQSDRVVLPEGVRAACIVINEGRIERVTGKRQDLDQVLDCGNAVILPGLVDSHVHVNEPGRTDWEGFETATRAAAAGGITTIVDMPLNCLPPTISVTALEEKRCSAEGKCWVDWAAWGGLDATGASNLVPLAGAGVCGFKSFLVDPGCDGLQQISLDALKAAMPDLQRTRLPLLVHAELEGPISKAHQRLDGCDWHDYSTYLASRPPESEAAAVSELVALASEFRVSIHIVHVSSKEAIDIIALAKGKGVPITAETCPHYIAFAADEILPGATEFKCAPPIREAAHRDALIEALRTGVLDLVASDHSPCPPIMKTDGCGDFSKAWGGIASLSVSLSATWTALRDHGFGFADLARLMSTNPARLAGLSGSKGQIAAGCDADLTVFDPNPEWFVEEEHLHFRHPVSPYLGRALRGRVVATILRGETVYLEREHLGKPRGEWVRP